MTHAGALVLWAILLLLRLILQVVCSVDGVLAGFLTALRVPPNAQIILLVVTGVWLALLAFRLLGPVFRILIIALLLLLLAHQAFPGLNPGHFVPPAAKMPPGVTI